MNKFVLCSKYHSIVGVVGCNCAGFIWVEDCTW